MRSFEPFGSRLFIQPLVNSETSSGWPVEFSHTWEIDGENRFCPRTLTINGYFLSVLACFSVFVFFYYFLGAGLWSLWVEVVLMSMAFLLLRDTAVALGIWRKGLPPEEIEARKKEEQLRSDFHRYNAVNDPVPWTLYYRARVFIALDHGHVENEEDLMLLVQEELASVGA